MVQDEGRRLGRRGAGLHYPQQEDSHGRPSAPEPGGACGSGVGGLCPRVWCAGRSALLLVTRPRWPCEIANNQCLVRVATSLPRTPRWSVPSECRPWAWLLPGPSPRLLPLLGARCERSRGQGPTPGLLPEEASTREGRGVLPAHWKATTVLGTGRWDRLLLSLTCRTAADCLVLV